VSNFELAGIAGAWPKMPTHPKLPFPVLRLLRQAAGPDAPEPTYSFETGDIRTFADLYIPDAPLDDLETAAETGLVAVEGSKRGDLSVKLIVPAETEPVIPAPLSDAFATFLESLGSVWTPDMLGVTERTPNRATMTAPVPNETLIITGDTKTFELPASHVVAAGLRLIVVEMIRRGRTPGAATPLQ
jgi:hypothetical protein